MSNLAVWGNHSTTQVPDFVNARIGGEGRCQQLGACVLTLYRLSFEKTQDSAGASEVPVTCSQAV